RASPRARGRQADRARDRAARERPRLYPSTASSFVLNASSRRGLGVLPSPLWGGGGAGGSAIPAQVVPASSHRTTPTPAQRSQACAGWASLPACAAPPHKGEGKDRVCGAFIRLHTIAFGMTHRLLTTRPRSAWRRLGRRRCIRWRCPA